MSEQVLLLERISRHSVDDWLALRADLSRDAHDIVVADMAENPRRERFILRDRSGPIGGFVVEFGEIAATTWMPRTRHGLSEQEKVRVYGEAVRHIVSLSGQWGMRYVECTLMHGTTRESAWKESLDLHQFRLLASKCEWVRGDRQTPRSEAHVRVRRVPPQSRLVARLYSSSTIGSGDREIIYESRFGTGLGTADLVLVASVDEVDAGLCACLHEPNAIEAWIKYVGTVPLFRRHGVARSLLAEAVHRLSHAGVKQYRCLIDTYNGPSITLHRGLGFEREGTCGDFYYRALRQE